MKTWDQLMRASLAGNDDAYAQLLGSFAATLRATVTRMSTQGGSGTMDIEDVVQETLLSIHLKRHTWDPGKPVAPWVMAIARNKLIDSFRRQGRRPNVPLEFVADTLEAPSSDREMERHDVSTLVMKLKPREQFVVRSIALEENSIRDTAQSLGLSEGAVRVLLHRTLKKLATLYRSSEVED